MLKMNKSMLYTPTGGSTSATQRLSHYSQLAVNSVADLVGFTVNLSLMLIILTKANVRPCHRVVNLLIAHSAFVSNLTTIINWFNTGNEAYLINVSAHFCRLAHYLRSIFNTAFLANCVAIIYERLKYCQEVRSPNSTTRTIKLVCTIWGVSILLSIPTAIMKTGVVESVVEENHLLHFTMCKSVHLLGSWEATVGYESLRVLVFYIGAGFYMIYVLREIRSRIKYLVAHSNVSRERLEQTLNCIRLIYFYLFTFFIVQMPFAVIVFYRRVFLLRFSSHFPTITDIVATVDVYLSPVLILYLYMSPLMSYLFVEGFPSTCGICFRQRPTMIISEQREVGRLSTSVAQQELDVLPTTSKSTQAVEHNNAQEKSTQNSEASGSFQAKVRESSV